MARFSHMEKYRTSKDPLEFYGKRLGLKKMRMTDAMARYLQRRHP